MTSIIIHMHNEDPVVGEIEDLPAPADQFVVVRNPRRRDGKDLAYLDASVITVIYPLSRITFIEILPSAEDEEIITHVRE